MSVTDMKSWMASHVFVTIGIVALLTAIAIFGARDALKKFHLRLVQLAAVVMLGLGLIAVALGAPTADAALLSLGGACVVSGAIAFYAVNRLQLEYATALQKLRDEIRQSKDSTALRLVLEPSQAKAAEKKK